MEDCNDSIFEGLSERHKRMIEEIRQLPYSQSMRTTASTALHMMQMAVAMLESVMIQAGALDLEETQERCTKRKIKA